MKLYYDKRLKDPTYYIQPVSYTHLTLPTSDLGVDLGGRRIIKKKTNMSYGELRLNHTIIDKDTCYVDTA